jgi:hypothetical protein
MGLLGTLEIGESSQAIFGRPYKNLGTASFRALLQSERSSAESIRRGGGCELTGALPIGCGLPSVLAHGRPSWRGNCQARAHKTFTLSRRKASEMLLIEFGRRPWSRGILRCSIYSLVSFYRIGRLYVQAHVRNEVATVALGRRLYRSILRLPRAERCADPVLPAQFGPSLPPRAASKSR